MDTVHEEASTSDMTAEPFLQPVPKFIVTPPDRQIVRRDSEPRSDSAHSSRRPSAIIAALRRPSQAIALSAAHAVMNQRRYIIRLFNEMDDDSLNKEEPIDLQEIKRRKRNRKQGDDALILILSGLYAKLLVVLGMAFPITEILSLEVRQFFYQGFYLYLYIGSIAFVAYMYMGLLRKRALLEILKTYHKDKPDISKSSNLAPKYGSFYLRAGAIAFGVGSMVYSGLDFGRYFELKSNPSCDSNILQAIIPATRMILTLVQIKFIFLNSKDVEFNKHKIVSRFGLMHMLATNLCEWLYVIVEETKHEIIHLAEHNNDTNSHFFEKYCQDGNIMGPLVTNSSPFLFPCTIEYSLICAVILFEIWKHMKNEDDNEEEKHNKSSRNRKNERFDRIPSHIQLNPFGGRVMTSNQHFTIDCSRSHKGLFSGILILVLTIISLIMFFVLSDRDGSKRKIAIFEVCVMEVCLYVITTLAVLVAMLKMRNLKYDRKIGHERNSSGLDLDTTLLVLAQTGVFIYCMFSLIGCAFTSNTDDTGIGVAAEVLSLIQTCLQTMFVLDGWWRRCRNIQQTKTKPGREIITFLLVANMALWTINTLEKNRAEFRPTHLKFFGDWAWTVITHISMPLAIFYRFHSTICLFEIWKSAYKIKTNRLF